VCDDWLRGQADDDPSGQGLLPLKLIGGFKMVKVLTTQALTLRKAVLSSPLLYVGIISGETYGVRRRESTDEVSLALALSLSLSLSLCLCLCVSVSLCLSASLPLSLCLCLSVSA
jgi:hypothetical protein